MIVTDFTRSCLEYRREKRDLEKQGYRQAETDWEIHRGGDHRVIVDAKVSKCGKYVWTKLGERKS